MSEQPAASGQVPTGWSDEWIEAVLADIGVLHPDSLARLRNHCAPTLWQACVHAGLATHPGILSAYSHRFAVPIADFNGLDPQRSARLLPAETARKLRAVAVRQNGRTLDVACTTPLDMDLETTLGFASGQRVRLLLSDPDSLQSALDMVYPGSDPADDMIGSVGRLDDGEGLLREVAAMAADATPTVSTTDLVNALIVRAVRQGASDVHIQPHDGFIGIRYRIDGAMIEVTRLPNALLAPITSRLKILGNLDISDRMRPQDGRAQVQLSGKRIDLRISTLPVGMLGEKTVVRILDSGEQPHTLGSLGFLEAELHRAEQLFRINEGLVLVTGPTGSGKTTTLYTALRMVQATGANIVTVEDPIEYRLDGVAQAQVNEKAGLTFATVLRSILRQDPDAVLVGEIRDRETAEVALQASMTGHIVLSTLHTNDAVSTIMRLADIGVDAAALAGSLRGVIAQRLVRRVCPDCRERIEVDSLAAAQRALLREWPHVELYQAVGCVKCQGIGYRGRIVIPEIAIVTPDMERAIARGAESGAIAELCRRGGMITLWEAGLERVARGLTTLNELLDTITPPVANDASPKGPDAQTDVDAIFRSAATAGAAAVRRLPSVTPQRQTPRIVSTRQVAGSQNSDRQILGSSPRVLVVDEDAASRRAVRTALEGVGFRVLEAADGAAALEYVERLNPEFVLLELVLPKLDGMGVLRALGSLESCTTVPLVLTTQVDPDLAVWAMELGALDVFSKPINPHLLAKRLFTLATETAA